MTDIGEEKRPLYESIYASELTVRAKSKIFLKTKWKKLTTSAKCVDDRCELNLEEVQCPGEWPCMREFRPKVRR